MTRYYYLFLIILAIALVISGGGCKSKEKYPDATNDSLNNDNGTTKCVYENEHIKCNTKSVRIKWID